METGIHIGSKREKSEYSGIADALVQIMHANADEKTKRAAIKAFSELGEVSGISVNGATVVGNVPVTEQHYTAQVSLGDAIEDAIRKAAWRDRSDDESDGSGDGDG